MNVYIYICTGNDTEYYTAVDTDRELELECIEEDDEYNTTLESTDCTSNDEGTDKTIKVCSSLSRSYIKGIKCLTERIYLRYSKCV